MRQVTKESTPETVGVAASSLVFPADTAGSCLQSDQHAEVEEEFPQTDPDIVVELKGKLHSLKPSLLTVRKSSVKQKTKKKFYWGINFPLTKLKMTMLLSYFTPAFQVMRH